MIIGLILFIILLIDWVWKPRINKVKSKWFLWYNSNRNRDYILLHDEENEK